MADDALTDDDVSTLLWVTGPDVDHYKLLDEVERIARRARAEGARDALNTAADVISQAARDCPNVVERGGLLRAKWIVRDQIDPFPQHEEQP